MKKHFDTFLGTLKNKKSADIIKQASKTSGKTKNEENKADRPGPKKPPTNVRRNNRGKRENDDDDDEEERPIWLKVHSHSNQEYFKHNSIMSYALIIKNKIFSLYI